jgi:hypothetical protein
MGIQHEMEDTCPVRFAPTQKNDSRYQEYNTALPKTLLLKHPVYTHDAGFSMKTADRPSGGWQHFPA